MNNDKKMFDEYNLNIEDVNLEFGKIYSRRIKYNSLISYEVFKELKGDLKVIENHLMECMIADLTKHIVCEEEIINIVSEGEQTYKFPKLTFKNLINKILKKPLDIEIYSKPIKHTTKVKVGQYYPKIKIPKESHFVLFQKPNDEDEF
jgi:hypothetical protein